MTTPIDVSLHALNVRSLLALFLIGVLPLLVVFGVTIWMNEGRAPKGATLFVLAIAGLIAGFGLWQLASVRMRVDASSLTVGGGFYRVSVPLGRIEGGSQIGRVRNDGLGARTNGIGMPGLQLGWFDIENGKKAFVAITDPGKVIRIPTQEGYTILVSPDDPDAVIKRLEQR